MHVIYSSEEIKKNEMGGGGIWHACGRRVHTGFCWRNLHERDHLEDLGGGKIILK
jgi:hypothetical protein